MTKIREAFAAPAEAAPRWLRRLRRALDFINTAGASELLVRPRPAEKETEG